MGYIANQRIKKGGKWYLAGDPIELTKDDLNELPDGAVTEVEDADDDAPATPEDAPATLEEAVIALPATAFKKDGMIRADELAKLNALFEGDITAEAVKVITDKAE